MATRKPGGGFKGQFNNRGQFRDGSGQQVKVDTEKGAVLRVRPAGGHFKRVQPIKRKQARETYGTD